MSSPLAFFVLQRRSPHNGSSRIGTSGASILLTLPCKCWKVLHVQEGEGVGLLYFRRLAPARTLPSDFPADRAMIGQRQTRPPSSRNFLSRCLDPLSPYKWLVCLFSALGQLRHWRQDAAVPPVPCSSPLPLLAPVPCRLSRHPCSCLRLPRRSHSLIRLSLLFALEPCANLLSSDEKPGLDDSAPSRLPTALAHTTLSSLPFFPHALPRRQQQTDPSSGDCDHLSLRGPL